MTPYEMWYGHVSLVRHLRVFGSTCYALIPKVHRKNLVQQVISVSSREWQLDCLDRFTNAKSFQEFDNQIPHIEGGIPILDQDVESSYEEHSLPHETPTTDDALSDVIDRIGRLNLDSVPTQSIEQPGPSEKGDVDDSNSPIDMDVSYDCQFNLPINFQPTSFKDTASQDEWKEAMQKEYDALIKNGTWKLVDPPLGTKPIGYKWVYKNKYKADGSVDKRKARLMAEGFA
eukprot:PITA_31043